MKLEIISSSPNSFASIVGHILLLRHLTGAAGIGVPPLNDDGLGVADVVEAAKRSIARK